LKEPALKVVGVLYAGKKIHHLNSDKPRQCSLIKS